jgi:predicted ATPase/DNA-binding CsgD family transcriptional regulator
VLSTDTRGATLGAVTTAGPAPGVEVTTREAEVLALIARHLTNAQIAEALVISERTVESHVSAMLRKLQLPDRRSLARHAGATPSLLVKSGRRGLPLPVTSFIGRTGERAALAAALAEHRLVTATGPGGVGKTRLALSVAAELAPARREGVWFVDLVHVADPAMVAAAVAETVGVTEQRTTSVDRALVASLATSDALLVIDNCEHVLDGVRSCIDEIMVGAPGITVLATSRTRLLLPYERVYVVPGLSVDDDGGDAVALFTARVAAATGEAAPPDTGRLAALCRALDGIALAIELAAARFATLGLDGLESGLDQRLRFLTAGAGAADRHSSLREAVGWSYDLLSPDDRALLRGIAVFASWFDIDAARAVAGAGRERTEIADGLARLAEHSLLVVERGEPTRYRALETIRQYGTERLAEAGELNQIRAAHERWCRQALAALRRSGAPEIDEAWCGRFDRVADDTGAALAWSAGDETRRAQAAELAAEFAALLFARGRPAQAQRRYEQAAALAPSPADRIRHLRLAGGAAASRYAGNDTLRLLRAAADAAREIDDRATATGALAWMSIYLDRQPGIMADARPGEAAALREEADRVTDGSPRSAAAIATARAWGTDYRDAEAFRRAHRATRLAKDAGDGELECAALDYVCSVYQDMDRPRAAGSAIERRLELIRTLPIGAGNGFEVVDTLQVASDNRITLGDLAGAGEYADRIARLPFFRDEHVGIVRRMIVDALAGRFDDVVHTAERFRIGWERGGRQAAPGLAKGAYSAAMVHGILGNDDRRAVWRQITLDLGVAAEQLDDVATGWAPTFDALLALHHGAPGRALGRLSADLDDARISMCPAVDWRPWYAAVWVEAAVLAHHDDALTRIDRARHAARDNPIASTVIERAAAIATGDQSAVADLATTFARLGCPYQEARTRTLVRTAPVEAYVTERTSTTKRRSPDG